MVVTVAAFPLMLILTAVEVEMEAIVLTPVAYSRPEAAEIALEVASPPNDIAEPETEIGNVPEIEERYEPATCAPIVLYETVNAEPPLKVEPDAAPEPLLLKVTAFATEPACPVIFAFIEVVEIW